MVVITFSRTKKPRPSLNYQEKRVTKWILLYQETKERNWKNKKRWINTKTLPEKRKNVEHESDSDDNHNQVARNGPQETRRNGGLKNW